jgi:rod shape-determining protein MreD
MNSAFIAFPVLLLLTVIQTTLLPQTTILGAPPQLIPLTVLAWALVRGSAEGLVWAFIGGLLIDLFSPSPVGLSSLALMTAVLLMTTLQQSIAINRFFIPMILGGIGMFTFSLTSVLLLRLSGYPIVWSTIAPVPLGALLHAFLILPVYWIIDGANTRFAGRGRVTTTN